MPRGVKCTEYTEDEQMRIALKYDEIVVKGGGNFSTVKAYVQHQLDGGSRRRSRHLKGPTVAYWATVKIPAGQAPGDDRRRYTIVQSPGKCLSEVAWHAPTLRVKSRNL